MGVQPSLRHDALELFNDQDQFSGIGGNETMLIALPKRHDRWQNVCCCSL